jgi:tetratricopeptide (TPR) repeat protein
VTHVRVGGLRWVVAVVALALTLGAARPAAAADPRELKARASFAAGRYQEALELFAKLYAETLHPTYLRNIGRCYQNLGDTEHAILSFRDYLRKQTITAADRAEVEGFLAEVEAEKAKQEQKSAVPEASTAPPSSEPAPARPLPAPETPGDDRGPAALVSAPAAAAGAPVYTRWWFWTIVGAVAVGAGLGIAGATGAFTRTQEGSCMKGFDCQ